MKKRVILGMSGGVDSSVAALLLKKAGYEVIGLFMKNWDEKNEEGICTATDDADDARRVAHHLGIPFYTINFEKEYWDRVFTYFLDEYKKGRTPNPDVMCNQEIKFNAFLDYAMQLEADYIAMGHYAQVKRENGRTFLLRGGDPNKDQSYFLSRITEDALSKSIFPIGHLDKSEVRRLAQEHHLITASKKDSTGVCFIGERNFNEFLDRYLFSTKGPMIDVDSKKQIGHHSGLLHYTYGQRKGLGIGGVGSGEPWFVVGKNPEKNILYIAQGETHPSNFSIALMGEDPSWINGDEFTENKNLTAKFRYRQTDIPINLIKNDDNTFTLHYEKTKGVTPGQVAVIYDQDHCLGSLIIRSTTPYDSRYRWLHE